MTTNRRASWRTVVVSGALRQSSSQKRWEPPGSGARVASTGVRIVCARSVGGAPRTSRNRRHPAGSVVSTTRRTPVAPRRRSASLEPAWWAERRATVGVAREGAGKLLEQSRRLPGTAAYRDQDRINRALADHPDGVADRFTVDQREVAVAGGIHPGTFLGFEHGSDRRGRWHRSSWVSDPPGCSPRSTSAQWGVELSGDTEGPNDAYGIRRLVFRFG